MDVKEKITSNIPDKQKDLSISKIKRSKPSSSTNPPVDRTLQLQRTIGNQAMQNLFESGEIQPKLTVGAPDDIYEQEADRVAEQVLRLPETAPQQEEEEEINIIQTKPLAVQTTPFTQRQTEEEKKEEEEEPLQAKGYAENQTEVSAQNKVSIEALPGSGTPLPDHIRAFMEPRFGTNFGQVRIHTDATASKTANAIHAQAYTKGTDVVFNSGRYAPESESGKRLLAHELTHVIQQTQGMPKLIQRAPFPGETEKEELQRKEASEHGRLAINRIEKALSLGYLFSTERINGANIEDSSTLTTETRAQRTKRLMTLIGDLWKLIAKLESGPVPKDWWEDVYVEFPGEGRIQTYFAIQRFYTYRMRARGMNFNLVNRNNRNIEDIPIPTSVLPGRSMEFSDLALGIYLVVKDPENRPQEWKRLSGFEPIDGHIVQLSSDRFGYFYYWYGKKKRLPKYPNQ